MRVFATAPIGALGTTSVSANTTNAQLFADYRNGNSALAAVLAIEGGRWLEARKFTIRASGNATTSGAFNVTTTLYGAVGAAPAVSPLVAGSWTVLKASTARAVGTITAPWFIEAHLCVDQLSGLLQGTSMHMVNNLFDAEAVITALSAVSLDTVGPCLSFAIGVTFSGGSATNVGRLYEFSAGW